MWPFKRTFSLKDTGLFEGFTDWHSHILPSVDDGVRSVERALEVLDLYASYGIAQVWFTPHIMEDVPNTTAALRERFAEFRTRYTGAIELHLAAENMLDGLFESRLEAGEVLPIGKNGSHLLVETSYYNPPADPYGILERIKAKGYYPLIAHPERYLYMEKADYERLRAGGAKLQLDLFSLVGLYGGDAREKAAWLLARGMYEAVGTDLHRKEICAEMGGYRLTRSVVESLERVIRADTLNR